MGPWGWALIGFAVWLAPALVAALMLGWGILRGPRALPAPGLPATEELGSTPKASA
jgi:hypothetical protein